MSDLLQIEDDLNIAQHLVEVAFMACADLTLDQGAPLRTLLDLASEKLKAITEALIVARGASQSRS